MSDNEKVVPGRRGRALGVSAVTRSAWAKTAGSAAPPTAAGKAFVAAIGDAKWAELRKRLPTVNVPISGSMG